MSRFDYVRYDENNTRIQEKAKDICTKLERFINVEIRKIDNIRACSQALNKLEETYMWIGKAIRDKQIAEGGDSTHISERTRE